MPENINIKKNYSGIILLLIILVAVVGVWFYYFNGFSRWLKKPVVVITSDLTNSGLTVSKNQTITQKTISQLQILATDGRFGDWPLGVVSLSDNRGNPFYPKQ